MDAIFMSQQLRAGQYAGQVMQRRADAGLLCAQTMYSPAQLPMVRHAHENLHLSLVLKGACAEEKQTRYERPPGHFTFYHAGERHRMVACSAHSTHLNVELEASFFQRYELPEGPVAFAAHRLPDLKFLLVQLYRELREADAFSPLARQALLVEVLAGSGPQPLATGWPRWARRTDEYLREHFDRPVSLSELATLADVHPVTISKYFRRYFGCTLGEYLRKRKVEHALSLIPATADRLSQVAYGCGFADHSHFTRAFTHYVGVRPLRYRQLTR